jgi:U4/U6.U5 tri-snRNP-associated protein 2
MQGDPIEFLSWLLNSLHITLNGTKAANSSIIYKAFQGRMKIYTKKIAPVEAVCIFLIHIL